MKFRLLHGIPFIWGLSMRTRAERRHNDKKKALRKRYITRNAYYSYSIDMQDYYDNLHQYSKNKIHCSCPICSAKTRNKGHRRKRKNYAPAINYRRMDLRRQQAMTADELDFLYLEDKNED